MSKKYEKIVMKNVKLKDSKKIYNIILECAAWLKYKGINQWDPPYPKNHFVKDIKNKKVYFFVNLEDIIGTATLSTKKPHYYPKKIWNTGNKIWYLTRFAVPRKFKDLKIGKILLDKIRAEAEAIHIKKLRIDIPSHNKKLIEYYRSCGFIKVGKAFLINTPSVLMEMGV